MVGSASSLSVFRPLLSPQQLEAQGRYHTSLALEQLRKYLQAHPGAMGCVRDDSELRLRRFLDGAAHCSGSHDFANDEGARGCLVL
mmetsp:Transcript_23576/g.55104  ORF Transcript_23576/g.55104 Transcript_23576/m.55104 type:complete len:86 (+) Transcript_23576:234-491(+)